MAALLPHGARRIGSSVLQQTQAAVTEERRRLVTRRMYSTQEQAHGGIEREIQQKIDELYDLIVEGEKNVSTSSWTNGWLIQRLSEEVTPRPSDSFLQDVQKTRRVYSGIRRAGVFSLFFLALDYFSNYEKVDRVMMMKEEHETREVETGSVVTQRSNNILFDREAVSAAAATDTETSREMVNQSFVVKK